MSKSPSIFYTMHDSTCSKLTVQSSTYKDSEKSHHPPEILVNDAVLIFLCFLGDWFMSSMYIFYQINKFEYQSHEKMYLDILSLVKSV